jgi:hypothetical protein
VGIGGDPEPADVDAAAAQLLDLVGQHLGVDDDAVPDGADLAGVEDAGRDQVELEHLAVAHDGVAGVVPALEADDEVGLLGEQVGHLALSLVAPLSAHYDQSWHDVSSVRSGRTYAPSPASRRRSGPMIGIGSSQISRRRETVRSPIWPRSRTTGSWALPASS